jgi:hypothetical protein
MLNGTLYECVNDWYDSLNDVHCHSWDDNNRAVQYPTFHKYFYHYLEVIDEFSVIE